MKLRLFLKNAEKPEPRKVNPAPSSLFKSLRPCFIKNTEYLEGAGLIFVLSCLMLSGCFSIKPTYTKEKIAESIIQLCKQEYNLEPKVWLLGETVWIYLPLPRLVTKDAQFDKEVLESINKVMMAASRVVLSMKPRPQFMAVVASDIREYGIDYTIITWIPDIVKFQLEFISRDEFFRRNIIRIKENPQALNDAQGLHIKKEEINMPDFLSGQIAQRIQAKFSLEPDFKDYFQVESIAGVFEKDTFKLKADIKRTEKSQANPKDILEEMLKITAFVIKEYDFKDFLLVEAANSATGEEKLLGRLALRDFLKK